MINRNECKRRGSHSVLLFAKTAGHLLHNGAIVWRVANVLRIGRDGQDSDMDGCTEEATKTMENASQSAVWGGESPRSEERSCSRTPGKRGCSEIERAKAALEL